MFLFGKIKRSHKATTPGIGETSKDSGAHHLIEAARQPGHQQIVAKGQKFHKPIPFADPHSTLKAPNF